jgi:hypothetical protein
LFEVVEPIDIQVQWIAPGILVGKISISIRESTKQSRQANNVVWLTKQLGQQGRQASQ